MRTRLARVATCFPFPISVFFVHLIRGRSAAEAERGHHEPAEELVVPPVGVGHAQRGALLRSESGHVRKRISQLKTPGELSSS